jgi:hypothetical protein
VQKNPWIAQNLRSRKLIEMRSNVYQNWKIWCSNPSSWQNLSEHVNFMHHEIFEK